MKERARAGEYASVDTECGRIDFEFERGAVKNVNLRVRPDGSVHVSAPRKTSFAFVENFVREHADWITERIRRARKRRAEGAESFAERGYLPFLGERVFIERRAGERACARYDAERGVLVVTVPDTDDAVAVSEAAERWAERRAKEILPVLFGEAESDTAGRFGTDIGLVLRRMRARWGSCNVSKRRITLNTALIYAPKECVRYVCMHELAHLAHAGHDEGFYRELAAICPDWKELRRRLNADISAMLLRRT